MTDYLKPGDRYAAAYDAHRLDFHGNHTCPENDWIKCQSEAIASITADRDAARQALQAIVTVAETVHTDDDFFDETMQIVQRALKGEQQ